MKKMLKPEMEFVAFNTEDVITTSGDGSDLLMKFGNPVKTATPGPETPAENRGFGGWSFSDTTTTSMQ